MTREEIRQTIRSFILANFLLGEAAETLQDSARSGSMGWVPGTTEGPALTFTSRLMQ